MTRHGDAVATTESLADQIHDLHEQLDELTDRMGDVADGLAAFNDTHQQLAAVSAGSLDATAGARPADD